jgi:hypothetical protein
MNGYIYDERGNGHWVGEIEITRFETPSMCHCPPRDVTPEEREQAIAICARFAQGDQGAGIRCLNWDAVTSKIIAAFKAALREARHE